MKKNKILGIILARSGSKGLLRKNMLKIGDLTLLGHAIQTALQSKYLTRVVCSADNEELMQEAKNNRAEVLFKRPAELASDTASSWSVVKHAVDWLETNENWSPDYVVLLQPTTPFRTASHIDEAIEKMFNEQKESCISVREVDYPPHWMFFIDEAGQGKRLFPEGQNIKRRQDSPIVWQPNGLIYIVNREALYRDICLPKEDTCFYKMQWNDSINIDNSWQYELSKILWNAN